MSLSIGGLALGIAAYLVSLQFIHYELSFDGFHTNKDSLYRIVYGDHDTHGSAYTSFVMGSVLKENFADIKIVRFNNAGGMRIPTRYDERRFVETRFYFTDPEVFEAFSFRLLAGDPDEALVAPFTAVITPVVAERYFGKENPLGKSLTIDWGGTFYDLAITGILESPPSDSHLQFEILISNATAEKLFTPSTFFTDWTSNFCYNYLLVPSEKKPSVETFLREFYRNTVPDNQRSFNVRLQPLRRIHLHSRLQAENSKNSDVIYVYVASTLGLLIIIVSFINYLTIQSSLYSKRAKELGVRLILGARPGDLRIQFIAESFVNLFISSGIAFLIIWIGSAHFTEALNIPVSLETLLQSYWLILISFLAFMLFISLYLLFFISNLQPASLFSGSASLLGGGRSKVAGVGLQSGISLSLIVGAIAISRQVSFVEEKSLGFDREHVLTVPYGQVVANKIELARSTFVDHADVEAMSLSSQVPPSNLNFKVSCFPGGGNPAGSSDPWNVAMVVADAGFLSTFGLTVSEGRAFADEFRSDSTESFMVNEAFVKQLDWKDPIGQVVEIIFNPGTGMVETKRGRVVGVIKNFHFSSLHQSIEPILFIYKPTAFFYASFRFTPGDLSSKLERMKVQWAKLFPEVPFDYYFVNQRLAALYQTEHSWSKNIILLSICAVMISCFGIFSLISFMVQRQLKEITVRRVLGATRLSIMVLLASRIFKIILFSFAISIPICLYFIDHWLSGFAYRTTIGFEVYVFAFFSFGFITFLVILKSIIRGSRVSVVESLRRD